MTDSPSPRRLQIDTRHYLGIETAHHLRDPLEILVAERAFLPQVEDLSRDWVASVGAPALKLLRERRGSAACRSFCAVGTGTGLDALAAIELLGAEEIGLTDLFEDVVAAAAANVESNLRPGRTVRLQAGAGDLLAPLRESGRRFDLIYENLPNLPLSDDRQVELARTSGSFVTKRTEKVPTPVNDWLLVLHYLLLEQARSLLAPGGAVVATLGARVPLRVLEETVHAAGFRPDLLTFGWKTQSEADAVIGAYAAWEDQGRGPFVFYPIAPLAAIFTGRDPAEAATAATEIEAELAPWRLDARAALAALARGETIGHTVAVLYATPEAA